jgi:TolA-binding protein
LESIGEFSEARRLFRLVRSRQDSEYWAGAEYHLGRIETEAGNLLQGRHHFMNCLELNPDHQKAAEGLNLTDMTPATEVNDFERIHAGNPTGN